MDRRLENYNEICRLDISTTNSYICVKVNWSSKIIVSRLPVRRPVEKEEDREN
jgi:hypothetical protein